MVEVQNAVGMPIAMAKVRKDGTPACLLSYNVSAIEVESPRL